MTLAFRHSILWPVSTLEIPVVRIQLRYPDEAIFVQRFAPNVTRGGIFLSSRSPHPVGTVIKFEIALMQGPPLLFGTGKVTWIREYDAQEPRRAHGMGVQFIEVAPACKPMLDRLLGHKTLPPTVPAPNEVPASLPRQTQERASQQNLGQLDGDPSGWIDEQGLRLATERARQLASRVDDVESLRLREREEPATLAEALAGLSRMLGPQR